MSNCYKFPCITLCIQTYTYIPSYAKELLSNASEQGLLIFVPTAALVLDLRSCEISEPLVVVTRNNPG